VRNTLAVILPTGLSLGGVTTWARGATRAVESRGGRGVLIIGPGTDAALRDVSGEFDGAPAIVRLPGPIVGAGRRIDPETVEAACDGLARVLDDADRVVLAPTISGDAYGLAIEIAEAMGERVRTLGVLHSEYPHDLRVMERYAPGLSAIAGVGERGAALLRERLPGREILRIPHGVECPGAPPQREAIAGRAVRLVYAGRLERDVKRVLACVWLADELHARGIAHEITIIGDGPARAEVEREAHSRASVRLLGAMSSDGVREHVARADALLLPSRHEALGYARLEAAAMGCVPIVTDTGSGHSEGIEDMRSGVLCPSHRDDDERAAAAQLAGGIVRLLQGNTQSIARGAYEAVRERFSLAGHADALHRALGACFEAPMVVWDHRVPTAFDFFDDVMGSGSVPSDACVRARRVVERIGERPILVHGAGRHTLAIWDALTSGPARVVAIVDDDPARWGGDLRGVPIIGPDDAIRTDARDLVLSSWLHEHDLLRRCAPLAAHGVRIHTLYGT
jgi:hypothetical protein